MKKKCNRNGELKGHYSDHVTFKRKLFFSQSHLPQEGKLEGELSLAIYCQVDPVEKNAAGDREL